MKNTLKAILLSGLLLLTLSVNAQTVIATPYTIVSVAPPVTGPQPFTNTQTLSNVTQSGSPANNYAYTNGLGGGVVSTNSWASGTPFTIIYTDPAITGGMPIGASAGTGTPGNYPDFAGTMFGAFNGNTGNFGAFHATDNSGNFYTDDGATVTGAASAMAKIVYDGTNITFYVSYTGSSGFRQFQVGGTPLPPFPIPSTTYYLKMGGFSAPQENDNVLTLPAL